MMGGLQFYNLHRELVDSKKMTDKPVSRRDSARRPDPGRNGPGDIDEQKAHERL